MSAGYRNPFLQNSGGTDEVSLALKMYAFGFGETFRVTTKLYGSDKIDRQDVGAGKSYQFLQMADTPAAEDFVPSTDEMVGQQYEVEEGTISADEDIVVSHVVSRDQVEDSHFGIFDRLAKADARQLAMKYDRRAFTIAALAARAAAASKNGLSVHAGGNRVTRDANSIALAYPLSATGAANLRADLRTLRYNMDLDFIPDGFGDLYLTPYARQVLMYDTTAQLFSRDYASVGDISKRELPMLEGFRLVDFVVPTSGGGSMPDQLITSATEPLYSKYRGDFYVDSGATDTVGTPIAIVLGRGPNGEAAVGEARKNAGYNFVKWRDETQDWLVGAGLRTGLGQKDVWCAGSVEVVNET